MFCLGAVSFYFGYKLRNDALGMAKEARDLSDRIDKLADESKRRVENLDGTHRRCVNLLNILNKDLGFLKDNPELQQVIIEFHDYLLKTMKKNNNPDDAVDAVIQIYENTKTQGEENER